MSNYVDPSTLGELEVRNVTVKRVTKVVKGGKHMRFTALIVCGDRNGHVGYGLGKAAEVAEAVRKGTEAAKKNLKTITLNENGSVYYDNLGVFGSAQVLIKKAPEGTGIIAGGPARAVLELAGVRNIVTKSLGSNNKNNVVAATIEALTTLKSPEEVARKRGKTVSEIMG